VEKEKGVFDRERMRTRLDSMAGALNEATGSPLMGKKMAGGKLVHAPGHFFVKREQTGGRYYRLLRVTNAQGDVTQPLGILPVNGPALEALIGAIIFGVKLNKGE
jgi:hypothetical protein